MCCRYQVSTELHDEPLADLLSVPLTVHLYSKSHVVDAVHQLQQPSRLVPGRRTVSTLLFEKLFTSTSSRTTNSEASPASRVTCQHLLSRQQFDGSGPSSFGASMFTLSLSTFCSEGVLARHTRLEAQISGLRHGKTEKPNHFQKVVLRSWLPLRRLASC